MAAGLLLLVCAVAVLYSAEAQASYNGLPEIYKKGVDLAMQQLSTHARVQHHYRFLRTVEKLETEGGFGVRYFYHHFYLKPTRCPKGTTETDPQRCPYRNDRVTSDGLCSLLQSIRRTDRSPAQPIRSLYPETETHRGDEESQVGSLQKNGLPQWRSYTFGCENIDHHHCSTNISRKL
uniref:Retinoic acid receptor responder protein 2 n=1 Tax=Oreochromis aureus TaxID=47969 RepID=A0A668RZT9_OREAU